jgi:hypothetical protein
MSSPTCRRANTAASARDCARRRCLCRGTKLTVQLNLVDCLLGTGEQASIEGAAGGVSTPAASDPPGSRRARRPVPVPPTREPHPHMITQPPGPWRPGASAAAKFAVRGGPVAGRTCEHPRMTHERRWAAAGTTALVTADAALALRADVGAPRRSMDDNCKPSPSRSMTAGRPPKSTTEHARSTIRVRPRRMREPGRAQRAARPSEVRQLVRLTCELSGGMLG